MYKPPLNRLSSEFSDLPRACHVGILAIEVYAPDTYVLQEELEAYDGVPAGKYTAGLGQNKMSFCGDQEDVVSMSLTAVKLLLEKYNVDPRDIGRSMDNYDYKWSGTAVARNLLTRPKETAGLQTQKVLLSHPEQQNQKRLEVGTESALDRSKSIKTFLMPLFSEAGNHDVEGVDNMNACYGGTAALFNAVNWVESRAWDGRLAIVVAADIAMYAAGPARPAGGCGAAALLIGPDAPLDLERGLSSSHMEHAYDFYKPCGLYPLVDGKWSVLCYLMALDKCYSTICRKYEQIFQRRSGGSRPEAARSLPVCTSRTSPRASLDGVATCSTPQRGGKAPQAAQGGPATDDTGEESNISRRYDDVVLHQATSQGAQALQAAVAGLAKNGAGEESNTGRRYADKATNHEMSRPGANGHPTSASLANGACSESPNGGEAIGEMAGARAREEYPASGAGGGRSGPADPCEPPLPRNAAAHGATCGVHVPPADALPPPHPSERAFDTRSRDTSLCQHSNGGACGLAGGTERTENDRVASIPPRPTNGRTDTYNDGVQYPWEAAWPHTLSAGTEALPSTGVAVRSAPGSGPPFALPPRGLAQGPLVSHSLGSGDLGSPGGPLGTEPRFSLREVDYAVLHSPYNKLVRKGFARLVYHDHVRERARACARNPHGDRADSSPPAVASAPARSTSGASVVSHRSFAPESGPDLVVSLLMHPPGAVAGGEKPPRRSSMDLPRGVTDESPLDAFPADPNCFEEGSYCDRRLERAALVEAVDQYAQKVAPGTEGPRECGNMYAASLPLGLASLVEAVGVGLEGRRILLYSYGSGLVASLFCIRGRRVEGKFSIENVAAQGLSITHGPDNLKLTVQLRLRSTLAARRKVPPAEFVDTLELLERRYSSAGYTPQHSPDALRPGTYYLKAVDSQFRRTYARKP